MHVSVSLALSIGIFSSTRRDAECWCGSQQVQLPCSSLSSYSEVEASMDACGGTKKYQLGIKTFTRAESMLRLILLWTCAGMYGESSVREVALATGLVLREKSLAHSDFGEGLVKVGSRCVALPAAPRSAPARSLELFRVKVDHLQEALLRSDFG